MIMNIYEQGLIQFCVYTLIIPLATDPKHVVYVILNDTCQILLAGYVNKIKLGLIFTGTEKDMKALITRKEIRFINLWKLHSVDW